jgi:hypothetical protein
MKKLICLGLVIIGTRLTAQQNTQTLIFGATTNVPGATLVFENASNYVTDSGYCFATVSGSNYDPQIYYDPGSYTYPYAGYYYNGVQIFNALPATADQGGPVDGAAALGTVIQLELLSVEGPAGAGLTFWEGNSDGSYGVNPTWSLPVPSSGVTNLIPVTQAANSSTNDPYGLVQNRVFGFTKPGLYKLTWQLVDTSTNGPGGTPQNLPSAPFSLYYQAGCTITSIASAPDGVQLIFAAPTGFLNPNNNGYYQHPIIYSIEQSPTLGADANWQPALDSQGQYININGDDYLHTNTVPVTSSAQFYRLNAAPVINPVG